MDVPNIPPGPLSRETAERLTRLLVAVTQNQAGGYPATPPPSFHGGTWASESVNDDYVNRELWARLTGYDSATGWYAWEEVISTSPDTTETPVYETKPGGRTGTTEENPAWEKDGLQVDYSSQPVVRLRREHWREDVGWCWAFSAGVANATFTPPDPPDDGSRGAITFNETDVYCIADVLKVYNRVVTVQITGGVLNRSYGDWEYSHDAGCCACDTVTTCCAPCDEGESTNVYLHVAVQTGPAGSTGYPSCYDCLDLQLQYNPTAGQWAATTCKGESCCDEQFPARIFMDVEGVYKFDGSIPPGTDPPEYGCQEFLDLVGTTTVLPFDGVGAAYGNANYGKVFDGTYAGGTWEQYFNASLCSNQYTIYGDGIGGIFSDFSTPVQGYVKQFAINTSCSGDPPNSHSGSAVGGSATSDFGCVGTIAASMKVLLGGVIYPTAYGVKPCLDCTDTYLVATFYTATVGDDGETPCPCVDFSWRCNETTDTYELVVSYDDGGITVATTYQPAASPDPCTAKEWVYENVALPDGSTATIYVNCSPTRDCANDSGSGSGGCNLTRVNQGSTTGAESVSLAGVVLEENDLLVVLMAFRAAAGGTTAAYIEGTPNADMVLLGGTYDTDTDLGVVAFLYDVGTNTGTKTVVASYAGADAVAVSVYCVQGLPATVTVDNTQTEIDPTTGDPSIPNDLNATESACPFLGAAFASDGGSNDTHGTWAGDWTSGGQDVGGLSSDPNPVYLMEAYQTPGAAGFYFTGLTGNTPRNWAMLSFAVY